MSLKYVEVELDDLPEYTPEEFKKLSSEEKQKFTVSVMMNLHKRTFLMAAALLKFGAHEADCTDDTDECTCGFDGISSLAIDVMETIGPALNPKDYKVN